MNGTMNNTSSGIPGSITQTAMNAHRPSGLTPHSFVNMQLGAGAFFVGIDTSGLTAHSNAADIAALAIAAKAAGSSLGATQGGGTFTATPQVRQIEADDMTYPVIGSTVFDSWEVKLSTTIKELTRENLQRVLSVSVVDDCGAIMLSSALLPEHYIPRLSWMGYMGSGGLIYIELHNALNIAGMTMTMANKGEASIPVEFRAHQADLERMQFAPCKIWIFDAPQRQAEMETLMDAGAFEGFAGAADE